MGETIEFGRIASYLADGGGPGIVVIHEWWGLVPHIREICDRFATLGYTALAPDLYHGDMAANSAPNDAERPMAELDRDRNGAVADVGTAVAELRRRGCERVATIGFCMGGALVLVHVAEHEEHNWPALPAHFPRWFEGMPNVEVFLRDHLRPSNG